MNNEEYDYPQDPKVKEQESLNTFQQGYQTTADANLIAHQQDPEPVLDPFRNSLLGNVFNYKTGQYESGNKLGIKPKMNIDGVNYVIDIIIRPCFNHFTNMGNIDIDQLYAMKEESEHLVNHALFEMEEEFEVDPSSKDGIIDKTGELCLIGLSRPLRQGEKVFLSKTQEHKSTFQTREPEKKGIRKILHL